MADKSAGVPALPWLAKLLSAASGARLLASFSSLPPPRPMIRSMMSSVFLHTSLVRKAVAVRLVA